MAGTVLADVSRLLFSQMSPELYKQVPLLHSTMQLLAGFVNGLLRVRSL
jgi:hypothetical protein